MEREPFKVEIHSLLFASTSNLSSICNTSRSKDIVLLFGATVFSKTNSGKLNNVEFVMNED